MNRLWVKLTLAFLAIALAAVGVVAVLSARTTGAQFRQYVVSSGMAAQSVWAEELVSYYARQGSWAGVETVLTQAGPGVGFGPGRGAMAGASLNLAVADASGRVVATRTGQMVGERLSASTLAQGTPLNLDGRPIGTLLIIHSADVALDVAGQAFLRQVQTSLVWAALLAVLLALALGLLVTRLLTAPLAHLTQAATSIAHGDLQQHVAIRGTDEIGKLGEAFNRMAASLVEAETLRKNLVADVAHELRTPLTIIQGNLQAILDGVYPLAPGQIAGIYDETRLLTRLVDDLHDLALADAGKLRLDRAPVDPVALAQSAIEHFTPAAEGAGVRLELRAHGKVGPVEGDADRLAQVLRNLLGNALRHTPAGGLVTVQVRQLADQVQLQVADTGSGISPEDLPHIFDRFYRSDKSRSRPGGGAGLGLAIARQLVSAHGGQIEVESTPGEGTTFTVTLPCSRG